MACSSVVRAAVTYSSVMQVLKREDGRIEIFGADAQFLKIILETLNLQLKAVIAEDGEWGRELDNGSWTGMIGKIQQNKADVAINLIGITEKRTKVVDFSNAYYTDYVTFAIEKQGFASTSTALIRPFPWSVWTIMLVTLFLLPLVFRFLLHTKDSYLNILFKMLGTILKQSFSSKHHSFTHRILVITCLIYAMIISFCYSSVLLSILTVPLEAPTVKNFEELSNAVENQNYKVFFDKGASILDYMLQHERKSFRTVAGSCIRNDWYISSDYVYFTPQINKKSAIVSDRVVMQVVAGSENWKWYFLSNDGTVATTFGMAMRKGFCHKKKMNTAISRMNSAGLYLKFLNDATFQVWLAHPERIRIIDLSVRPLSFGDLIGAFLLYLTALGISCVFLIIEILNARV